MLRGGQRDQPTCVVPDNHWWLSDFLNELGQGRPTSCEPADLLAQIDEVALPTTVRQKAGGSLPDVRTYPKAVH